jgi:hypothetical protein
MSMEARYSALLDEIAKEFPGFRVVKKDQSRFQRAIGAVLRVLTFGAQKGYLTRYQTTIGRTVYVTPDWDDRPAAERYITMRHERVHLRQFRRWTLPGMAVAYVLLPFPVGVAWCRMRFERAGYEESIRAAAEVHGLRFVEEERYREYVIEQFTGGGYGWMWPFRAGLERWYDAVLASLKP